MKRCLFLIACFALAVSASATNVTNETSRSASATNNQNSVEAKLASMEERIAALERYKSAVEIREREREEEIRKSGLAIDRLRVRNLARRMKEGRK